MKSAYCCFILLFSSYFIISLYSAGIGRSGCFILIDAMLEQIDQQGTVDVYSYFKYLRTRRINMVQNVVGVNINFLQESLYNPEEDARESQYRIKKKRGGGGAIFDNKVFKSYVY